MAVQKLDDQKGVYIDREIPSVSLLNIYSQRPAARGEAASSWMAAFAEVSAGKSAAAPLSLLYPRISW